MLVQDAVLVPDCAVPTSGWVGVDRAPGHAGLRGPGVSTPIPLFVKTVVKKRVRRESRWKRIRHMGGKLAKRATNMEKAIAEGRRATQERHLRQP